MSEKSESKFKTIDTEVDGVSGWTWPAKDTELWYGNNYDWPDLKKGVNTYCKKFDVAIQAGGACGMYPRLFANFFKHVYTFEPDPINFFCLVNNCKVHNVTKINGALGGGSGFVSMDYSDPTNAGMHKVSEHETQNHIPVFAIDQFDLQDCDLIQLDCEGYEENIIIGAVKTIEKFKPVITLETVTPKIQNILFDLGYKEKGRFGHADLLYAVG